MIRAQEYIDFATASYLGFDTCPIMLDIISRHLFDDGIGRCASPSYVASSEYLAIQEEIMRISGLPRVILFSSNTLANYAALRHGVPRKSTLFADEYAHRSLYDAMRGASTKVCRYLHRDCTDLQRQIDDRMPQHPIVVTDGMFSMSGEVAPLIDLWRTVTSNDGWLIVDDAHGFGVTGERGQGSIAQLSGLDLDRVILTGSLSKGLAGTGGFIACGNIPADRISRNSAEYGFSCAIPHLFAVVAAEAAKRVGGDDWLLRVKWIRDFSGVLQMKLANSRHPLIAVGVPIASIRIKSREEMKHISLSLRDSQICFNAVGFPAIPKDEFRIRLCLTAAHTSHEVDVLGRALAAEMVL